jgi:hypothetical protein
VLPAAGDGPAAAGYFASFLNVWSVPALDKWLAALVFEQIASFLFATKLKKGKGKLRQQNGFFFSKIKYKVRRPAALRE